MDPMTAVGEGLGHLGNTLGAAMKDDGDGPAGPLSGAIGPMGRLPGERRRENRPDPGMPFASPEQREIQELYDKKMDGYERARERASILAARPGEFEEHSRRFWREAEEEVLSKEKAEAAVPSGGLPQHAGAGTGPGGRPLHGTPGVLGGAGVGPLHYRPRTGAGQAGTMPAKGLADDGLDGPGL